MPENHADRGEGEAQDRGKEKGREPRRLTAGLVV